LRCFEAGQATFHLQGRLQFGPELGEDGILFVRHAVTTRSWAPVKLSLSVWALMAETAVRMLCPVASSSSPASCCVTSTFVGEPMSLAKYLGSAQPGSSWMKAKTVPPSHQTCIRDWLRSIQVSK